MSKRTLAVLVTAGLILGGGSAAWAQTAPPRTPPEVEARKAAAKACRDEAARTRDVEAFKACLAKAGITHQPGRFKRVMFDRGTVAASTTADRIVLNRPDGQTISFELTANTRYRGIANAAAIERGKPARVISRDGKALVVAQHTAGNKAPRAVVPKP